MLNFNKNTPRKILATVFGCVLSMGVSAGMVSVSNYPLALLSNAVTKGAEPANVLLQAGDVGHHGSLSPSKVKSIQDSDFVVWFGEDLEQNLVKNLSQAPNAISLLDFNAFERLPLREVSGQVQDDTKDAHIWLEPKNAKAIVRALAVIHSHANPEHKELYQKNAEEFQVRMDEAVAKLNAQTSLPYWAYHDAFAYLESSANLQFAGALTPDHHLSPKASQIRTLKENRPAKQMCLASQSTVSSGIVNKLENVQVIVRQEDMSDGTDFVDAWLDLAQGIRQCASTR